MLSCCIQNLYARSQPEPARGQNLFMQGSSCRDLLWGPSTKTYPLRSFATFSACFLQRGRARAAPPEALFLGSTLCQHSVSSMHFRGKVFHLELGREGKFPLRFCHPFPSALHKVQLGEAPDDFRDGADVFHVVRTAVFISLGKSERC